MAKKSSKLIAIEQNPEQFTDKPALGKNQPNQKIGLVSFSLLLTGLLLCGFVFGGLLSIYHDYTTKNDRITYYRPAKNVSPQQDKLPDSPDPSLANPVRLPATGGSEQPKTGSSDTATYTIQIYAPIPNPSDSSSR